AGGPIPGTGTASAPAAWPSPLPVRRRHPGQQRALARTGNAAHHDEGVRRIDQLDTCLTPRAGTDPGRPRHGHRRAPLVDRSFPGTDGAAGGLRPSRRLGCELAPSTAWIAPSPAGAAGVPARGGSAVGPAWRRPSLLPAIAMLVHAAACGGEPGPDSEPKPDGTRGTPTPTMSVQEYQNELKAALDPLPNELSRVPKSRG